MEFHRTGTEAAGDRVFDVERDGISERDELRLVAADSADCFPPTNLDRRGFPRRVPSFVTAESTVRQNGSKYSCGDRLHAPLRTRPALEPARPSLSDGSRWRIIRILWSHDVLATRLSALGWSVRVNKNSPWLVMSLSSSCRHRSRQYRRCSLSHLRRRKSRRRDHPPLARSHAGVRGGTAIGALK